MGDPTYALDRTAALFFFLTFSYAGSPYRSWVTGQSIGGAGLCESYIGKEPVFFDTKKTHFFVSEPMHNREKIPL